MSRNRDELKKGLPKLESMLIDFLLDSGIGPKHIKGNIVLQYSPKIQELCDNITKIRQTALKEIDGSSETPNDLEEAVEKQIDEALFKWSYDNEDGIEQYVHDAFIAGAKWQKEQMMEDAINGWLDEDNEPPYDLNVICEEKIPFGKFKPGDKVRIVVLKEEEE